MKNDLIYFVLAALTGALIPIQAATNAQFSRSIGNPYITGLMVFAVGLAAMVLFIVMTRTSLPTITQLRSAPLSGYIGGLIVATYVIMITILAPKIGVGPAIGLIVTGQIICAVAIDHFGLFHVAVRAMDVKRLAGVVLMICGVYLVMKK